MNLTSSPGEQSKSAAVDLKTVQMDQQGLITSSAAGTKNFSYEITSLWCLREALCDGFVRNQQLNITGSGVQLWLDIPNAAYRMLQR